MRSRAHGARASWGALALLMPLLACKPNQTVSAVDAGEGAPKLGFDPIALARAEDTRHAEGVPPEVQTSHEVLARRRSARALARIADGASAETSLGAHLSDEDGETVAWAAYGLGYACKGHEEAHIRLLSARAASLSTVPAAPGKRGASELDPRTAIARALGRCAAPLSESMLLALLASRGPWTIPALLGLGDLANRRKQLGPDALTALVESAGDRTSPQDLAFYALGRVDSGEAFGRRIGEVARLALGRPGDARIFAIRALGRVAKESPKEIGPELVKIATDGKGFGVGERAEAARALGGLGAEGQLQIASAVSELTPDAKDALAITELAGAEFNVLSTLLRAFGPEAPKRAEPALSVLASLKPPAQPNAGFAHRLATIRCLAALALARGAYDADVLLKCDAEGSEPWQEARLAALQRRPLGKERLAAFRLLAKSEHLRIREAAVEALATHPEVAEASVSILADALASKHAGLVAAAAAMVHAHPERASVLAESEKRAALDPKAPPPTTTPAQEVAPAVARALTMALAEKWPEDRFETRVALLEAAVSCRLPAGKESATLACTDANPVVRERSLKALRTLGAPLGACDAKSREVIPAAEIGKTITGDTKIVFATDAGELAIVLEPELSPITATRLVGLARSGFYKGVVVHRVVPGFVVQLGDPEGDGYGGSGTSLRCETSPVPFGPLDVGMALSGRDTGSSQFFVTLSRTPHLDGEYTRVGHAEGNWQGVAQGEIVRDVRVIE